MIWVAWPARSGFSTSRKRGAKRQKQAPVIVKGLPREQDFAALDRLADEIVKKHKDNRIME
ncbi:MAG: hypothetical protein CVT47_00375 [Thermoplasmata archaeon HGW-Thermoplasmata-2]|nr:MAG: hypothetical protein CVT47_00375 [Thermoplasmata archaeon HGW-Thermoplasmata-2]